MNGPVEIEVKFVVHQVDPLRERIVAMGAVSFGRFFETNICFEDKGKTFKRSDFLLRLRQDEKNRLTVKTPPDERDGEFKIYRELEVEVDDFETCRAILQSLGFHPEQVYEKWRETFSLGETKLLLDTTPYGVFLENEGEKAAINHIPEELALKWEERILLNYLAIFEILRAEENLPFSDMTFDNFKGRPIDLERYLSLLFAT